MDWIWGGPMEGFWATLVLVFSSNYQPWNIQYFDMSNVKM